jgi:hypothetical protein
MRVQGLPLDWRGFLPGAERIETPLAGEDRLLRCSHASIEKVSFPSMTAGYDRLKMEQQSPPTTPSWLLQIVGALETIETLQPAFEVIPKEGDFPPWVANVAREFLKALFPVAKLKTGPDWTPGEVGALLGHKWAYRHWLLELLDSLGKKVEMIPKKEDERMTAELRKLFGDDIEERITKFAERLGEMLAASCHAERFCLGIALDQDHLVASKFFTAFAKAMVRKPASMSDVGRTNTMIYLVLLLHWRHVETLRGIPDLHRMLCKHPLLKSSLVGSLKRIEKICERAGLSYREIASRNNHAGQSDMSASSLSGDKPGDSR